MKTWGWIGMAGSFVLGLLFPYVLVGGIILLYGFMGPPTMQQRVYGLVIVCVYLLLVGALNYFSTRTFPERKERYLRLFAHLLAWVLGAAISFVWIRGI